MNVEKSRKFQEYFTKIPEVSRSFQETSLFPGVSWAWKTLKSNSRTFQELYTNSAIIMIIIIINNNKSTGVITAHYWMFGKT
jgi:hypothetical protein